MPTIKLRLEAEEYEPIQRLAKNLEIKTEDVVYTAINQLMMKQADKDFEVTLQKTHKWRKLDLPTWADKAQEIHAYEGS